MAKLFNLYAFSSKDMLTSRSDDFRRENRNNKKSKSIIHIKQNKNDNNSQRGRHQS